MSKKEEIRVAVSKVLKLRRDNDEHKLQEYLHSIEEELVYKIFAVYYTGRDPEISSNIWRQFNYNLSSSKNHKVSEIISKIIGNIPVNELLEKGMKRLEL